MVALASFAQRHKSHLLIVTLLVLGGALILLPSLTLGGAGEGDYWLDDSASIPPRKKFFVKP